MALTRSQIRFARPVKQGTEQPPEKRNPFENAARSTYVNAEANSKPARAFGDIALRLATGNKVGLPPLEDRQQTRKNPNAVDLLDPNTGMASTPVGLLHARPVTKLTQEQWATLTPEKQQQILTNAALYKAALADEANARTPGDEAYNDAAANVFANGLDKGLNAPTVVQTLTDLGYANGKSPTDLNQIMSGDLFLTTDDVLDTPNTAKQTFYDNASSSTLFDGIVIEESLAKGRSLIEALLGTSIDPQTGSIMDNATTRLLKTAGVYNVGGIETADDQTRELVADLVNHMADRVFLDEMEADPDLKNEFMASLGEVRNTFGDNAFSQYVNSKIGTFNNTDYFLTPEEFRQRWMVN